MSQKIEGIQIKSLGGEMVDTIDSKSIAFSVEVRVLSRALKMENSC
jgi:hypothetical protein